MAHSRAAQLLTNFRKFHFNPHKQKARPLQYEPGMFLHTNAIDYYTNPSVFNWTHSAILAALSVSI